MKAPKFSFSPEGVTTLDQYNSARPFSSFFPGIAGLDGIPMWAFTVNRGQCVSSFGVQNKDRAILEFFSANRAYQLTPLIGFRTFLKVRRGGKAEFYEPFRSCLENERFGCTNRMSFDPASLRLEEVNPALGLRVEVTYITVPGETFPALARRVRVENLGKDPAAVELIDGLPYVKPHGLIVCHVKEMSYTSTAWIGVFNHKNNVPVYKLKIALTDRPEVDEMDRGGTFSAYFGDRGLLPAIIDPQAVFGPGTDLNVPWAFADAADYRVPDWQTYETYTPCGMTFARLDLPACKPGASSQPLSLEGRGQGEGAPKPLSLEGRGWPAGPGEGEAGQSREIHGIFGHAKDSTLVNQIAARCASPEWFQKKLAQNQAIMAGMMNGAATFSASNEFDNYCRLTFLDNTLRGGLPVTLPRAGDQPKQVFHVFGRVHGDMERDYNHIVIEPTYWSQGNGNYRDMLQNRRNDLWFNPDTADHNILYFLNLIQLDGYNPVRLRGSFFALEASQSAAADDLLRRAVPDEPNRKLVAKWLAKPFSPGEILTGLADGAIATSMPPEELLARLIALSRRVENTHFGEGYWSDHWIYNQDLIDSYLALYPERKAELLTGGRNYTYYQPCVRVNPRKMRFVFRDGKPFHSNNLTVDHDRLQSRCFLDDQVRTLRGRGEVYRTCLLGKLLCLLAVKMTTLDPFGVGVEMEGGRPNWNDSINGLPGVFGSSINETIELKRLAMFLLDACKGKAFDRVAVPAELAGLLRQLKRALKETAGESDDLAFQYWDQTNTAKERYRAATANGVTGKETELSRAYLAGLLKACLTKLDRGIARSIDPVSGVVNSYFMHEMTQYDTIEEGGKTVIVPKKFTQQPTALFLEGPMHYMRLADPEQARKQYQAVRASPLYDRKLSMYKVCESLKNMPLQLGRITNFAPGWLENESIYLHMEYKYLMETLQAGLYPEFFDDFRKAAVCFLDPMVYGRSILENSSFLVCSNNPNPTIHGGGFYARLSGSTAELIQFWLHMNLGRAPFYLDRSGKLAMRFEPILPAWLFNPQPRTVSYLRDGKPVSAALPAGHYAFMLLARTLVVYANPAVADTFGPAAAKAQSIELLDDRGQSTRVEGGILPEALARRVRDGEFARINVTLA